MFRRFICALLVSALSGFGQWPQQSYPESAPAPADGGAAPEQQQNLAEDMQHGVARISIVQGDVNVQRGDNSQLTGAVTNAPVMARDHVETSAGSRAEVELDANAFLRLGPNTDASFATLQYRKAQIQLGLGTVIYRVLASSDAQVEIDTPSVGIRALGAGEYRISVFDNGTSQITVRSGQLEMLAPRGSERLNAGQSVLVRGDATDPEMQTGYEIARDQFDDWSAGRDRDAAPSQSLQYVSADVQGASDLDRNGNWVQSGYGEVWHPQAVAPDWSPYSDGQWSYLDYYGWTWVDAAPWGWAPYHYGRWFWNTGYGWCWWPGARHSFSYWSPALVGFFGWGGRAGIGIGLGGLGWVALAPFEVFHSWWGRGGYGYRGGYTLAGFRNAGVRGGAITTAYNGFGGPHAQRFTAATRSQLTGATAYAGRLPINATAQSYRFSSRTAVSNPRLGIAQNRTYFHSQQTFRSGTTAYPSRSPATGWQHFGSPSPSTNYRQNFSQKSEASGWHNFGQPQSASRPAYSAPRQSYSAPRQSYQPRYTAPAPHYSAPATPHYSQPSGHSSGGQSRPSGGGGHSSGGGGGHRGR